MRRAGFPGGLILALAGVFTLQVFCGLAWANPADPFAIPIPDKGAYTGAYCPASWSGDVTEKSIYDFETATGKKAFFVQVFVNWLQENPVGEADFSPFPSQACETIRRRGSIPLITWQPNMPAKDAEGYMLDRISGGEFDDYLRAWADKIKKHPGPVLLRWGHEMNGDWFSWSGAQNGGGSHLPGDKPGPAGPTRFLRAWRHIQDVFRIQGVKNVRWVWSVYHSNVAGKSWNDIASYWPGDERVNWIGISAVNWSRGNRPGWKEWKSFSDIVEACYREIAWRYPNKPIFITEMACANHVDVQDGDKANWIRDALKKIPKKYTQIKAICWFNQSVEAEPGFYPANFTLDFAPHRKAYAQGLESSYYWDSLPKPLPPKRVRSKSRPAARASSSPTEDTSHYQ